MKNNNLLREKAKASAIIIAVIFLLALIVLPGHTQALGFDTPTLTGDTGAPAASSPAPATDNSITAPPLNLAPAATSNNTPTDPNNPFGNTGLNMAGAPTGVTAGGSVQPNKDYTLLAPLPCNFNLRFASGLKVQCDGSAGGNNNLVTSINASDYIIYMYNLFIAVAAVMAVFMIVLGGFEYMTTDALQKKSDGRKKIQNAIYGLILILCSYLILRTINPAFVSMPSTIVKPLSEIGSSTPSSNVDNYYNNVAAANGSDLTAANSAAATSDLNDAKALSSNLQSQWNDLQAQLLDPNITSTEEAAIQAQQAAIEDQLNTVAASTTVDTAILSFQDMAKNGSSASIDNINAALNKNESILGASNLRNQTITTPEGFQTTAEQELEDQAAYAKALVQMQLDTTNPRAPLPKTLPETQSELIIRDAAAAATSIKNPYLQQQLVTQAQQAATTLK